MQKDFDLWNQNKKHINDKKKHNFYKTREVWWCSLGTNIGFEQDGDNKTGDRPVLILRGFSKQVCLIIPLTTSEKKNPYHIPLGKIGSRNAFAIISQIRLIDTKRLINKIGFAEKTIFEKIRKAIRDLF
jgi:mRNA-degrading endonuclease toxin of MazEF toxin-antitoxin module